MKLLLLLMLFSTPGGLGNPHEPPSPEQIKNVSYILGNQFGLNFHKEEIELDVDQLIAGLRDGLAGNAKFDETEARKMLSEFSGYVREQRRIKVAAKLKVNQEEADKFMAANKEKEGVVTLESGLQYKVVEEGSGATPKFSDKVTVHYRGKLLDGTEFDSSYRKNQPATFSVRGVIPGWIEALQKMKVGSKWEVYIPPRLAYGPRGSGRNVPGNSALIFDIHLLEIVGDNEAATEDQ